MLAGGRWKGDYIVVDLRDLDRNPDTAHVHVQRIKEVYISPDDGFTFPMVARFNEKHRWLPGPEGDEGDFGCPGAPLAEAEMAERFALADEKSPIPPPPVEPPPPCPDDDPAPAGKPKYGTFDEQGNRITRKQKTTRPDSIPPELWRYCSKKDEERAIAEEAEKEAARAAGGASSSSGGARAPTVPATEDEVELDRCAPTMPVCLAATTQDHRPRDQQPETPWIDACVARPVSKREVARTPAALAVLQKEWDKLRAVDCCDANDVME